MSKKDFDEYYNSICEQYEELNAQIKEFEKVVQNGLVEPERLDNMKKVFAPIMESYQTVSWIAFLLNKPNRGSKVSRFLKSNKRKIGKLDASKSMDATKEKNSNALNDLRGLIHKK